jgi:hypothetical protein
MFIKRLYRHSKILFFAFVLFIVAFIFINYKWGLTATPIYQYGMFSSKFYIKDTQSVFKIYVNEKLLDITKYSFAERDIMLVTLEKYGQQVNNNEAVYTVMKKIPQQFGITMPVGLYRCMVADKNFTGWYKKSLQQIIGYPVKKLEVYKQQVAWGNDAVQEITSPTKLSFIAAD